MTRSPTGLPCRLYHPAMPHICFGYASVIVTQPITSSGAWVPAVDLSGDLGNRGSGRKRRYRLDRGPAWCRSPAVFHSPSRATRHLLDNLRGAHRGGRAVQIERILDHGFLNRTICRSMVRKGGQKSLAKPVDVVEHRAKLPMGKVRVPLPIKSMCIQEDARPWLNEILVDLAACISEIDVCAIEIIHRGQRPASDVDQDILSIQGPLRNGSRTSQARRLYCDCDPAFEQHDVRGEDQLILPVIREPAEDVASRLVPR